MTERTMTPAEAAALLEVAVDAELEQVERAFRYQAQRSHPDRMASATPSELAAAAARFDRFTLARSVLREADDERRHRSPTPDPAGPTATPGGSAAPRASRGRPAAEESWAGPIWAADVPYEPVAPPSPWLFWVWLVLYVVAALVSFLGGPLPYSGLDLWLRLLPLGLAAAAYARTGRQGFLAVVVALGGATAALTIAFASFGPLVSMIMLAAPVLGLVALGRYRLTHR
ncbi:hypothetical protein [Cryobacterium sp. AP23]